MYMKIQYGHFFKKWSTERLDGNFINHSEIALFKVLYISYATFAIWIIGITRSFFLVLSQ